MIRVTKDRPPQGSLKRDVTAGTEKSLTSNGGKAVDCWSGVNIREEHKVQEKKGRKSRIKDKFYRKRTRKMQK